VCIAGVFRLLAQCGEVAAPPVVVVRNAQARFIILARLFARLKRSCFCPLYPDLGIRHVAFLAVHHGGEYCVGQAEREDHAKQDTCTRCHFFCSVFQCW